MAAEKSGALSLSERRVVEIWQRLLLDRTELVTDNGETIKVVYPGRINDDRGADFRDAVIATRQGLIKGDIEVHVKASHWQAHQHHHDPAYNRVVLHVTMWDDAKSSPHLLNEKDIPVLALERFIKNRQRHNPPAGLNMPCLQATNRLAAELIAEWLDAAGEERFSAKAAKFRLEIAQVGASQTLYRGIMGALGYSKNKLPCLELAHRLPLQALESVIQSEAPEEEGLARQQALLLGTAGLLPSQRPTGGGKPYDEWTDRLERLWASFRSADAMSYTGWNLFKVRPPNLPVRRIAAMSYLTLRYRESGMLAGIKGIIEAIPVERGHQRLEEALQVKAEGYWANHFDFGFYSRAESPLIGSGRAADIVVNIVLPFVFAWSQLTSQSKLSNKALDLYHNCPRLPANAVERHMSHQLGIKGNLANSARRQQGLLHIYNSLCTQGGCGDCRLSQLKIGHRIQV